MFICVLKLFFILWFRFGLKEEGGGVFKYDGMIEIYII